MDYLSLVIEKSISKRKAKSIYLDSPFSCYVTDLSHITVSDSLTSAHVGLPLSFDIHHWALADYHNDYLPLDVLIIGRFHWNFLMLVFLFFTILSSIGSFCFF